MNVQGFKKMSDSLRFYHRITNEKYSECSENNKEKNLLEKVYVDILPNNGVLEKVFERNTTFLVGQRGTGKSTIIAMAQNYIGKKKKDLSIYINAKTIYKSTQLDVPTIGDLGETSFTQEEVFRLTFIKKSMESLCESMIEELKSEKTNIIEKFTGNNKVKQVEDIINEVQELLKSEDFQRID